MYLASRSSCCLNVSFEPKSWLLSGWRFGAPGQSVLKSGLPISVTRRLYLVRMDSTCPSWVSLSSCRLLFHMPRNSTQFRPKSFEITEQAWSKSCEISSEMTAILKGEDEAVTIPNSGLAAHAVAVIPAPARKL